MEGQKGVAETVAHHAHEYREAWGLSQRALAELMNRLGNRWSDTVVSRVERGERDISAGELVDLALVFGVEPQTLLRSVTPAMVFGGSLNPLPAWMYNAWLRGGLKLQLNRETEAAVDVVAVEESLKKIVQTAIESTSDPEEDES